MAKVRASEKGPGAPPLLDSLREELEGLSSNGGVIAVRSSALVRVRGIRNVHVAQCGNVFFKRNKFGLLIFLPNAGKTLLNLIFDIH